MARKNEPVETPVVVDVDPHDAEDPEEHLGEEIPDPWSDDNQPDWPNNESGEDAS